LNKYHLRNFIFKNFFKYKIPHYVYFTFINKICNEYKYLEITENDTEDIEEHKQFLKLNLRYVINKRTEDNNFNYHKTIAPELITAIETCNIINQYYNQIRNNYMKTILDQNIVEDDVINHIFMSYTNNNNLDTINFKSIDQIVIHNKEFRAEYFLIKK